MRSENDYTSETLLDNILLLVWEYAKPYDRFVIFSICLEQY